MHTDVVAELANVTKRHGAVLALDQVSLGIRAGEVYALLGPNGAGKSTAIGCLLGLLPPDAGQVRLFGLANRAMAARRRVGVMLQTATLSENLTVIEVLNLVRSYYEAPRSIADIVAMAGLQEILQRRYGALSVGQQRRVQFALAVCGRPDLLFLDEPTVGMDTESRTYLWSTVRHLVGGGCAVVLTTHYLEEAEALAHRVGVLARGRLVAEGDIETIRARVSYRQIRCVSGLDLAQLSGWSGVHDAERQGEWLNITTREPETVLRRLLQADTAVRELEVRRAGLAEALNEITREAA
ncbi:ABC transporter ATP-binding protein [Tahibacter amnicola]|uniref:ABC transporter ATP-binding protein n=1 Tax=Tahibacter amnicola TaxID=2976241 RepID=A0ABY6BJI9_9GAMM|nr:ABC transporter ATP-binding protein [Tahibacter amnicola]UXI69538.1 ABC transporter ATP-binding protein [Tahibacter amnicola]